jgi:hypothetical protein
MNTNKIDRKGINALSDFIDKSEFLAPYLKEI